MRTNIRSLSLIVGCMSMAAVSSIYAGTKPQAPVVSGRQLVSTSSTQGIVYLAPQTDPGKSAVKWFKDGAEVPAAWSAEGILLNAEPTLADAGRYSVGVMTPKGQIVSDGYQVAVVEEIPSIEVTKVAETTTVTLTLSAAGNGLTYQWYRGKTPLRNTANKVEGANAAKLTLTNCATADEGDYTCKVTFKKEMVWAGRYHLQTPVTPDQKVAVDVRSAGE